MGFAKLLIRLIPPQLLYYLLGFLRVAPKPMHPRPEEQEILDRGEKFTYGDAGDKIAWTWGEGPLVIFIHGWAGCGGQLAPLADAAVKAGFQVVVFDLGAHGFSAGKRVGFNSIMADIVGISNGLSKPVYAYVGHSAGGLCAMAARRAGLISAEQFICINAPFYPYPGTRSFKKLLDAPERVMVQSRRFFAKQFDTPWDDLKAGHAYKTSEIQAKQPLSGLLLMYDEADKIVDHKNGDTIQRLWAGSLLVKSKGLGHNRILADKTTQDIAVEFLVKARAEQGAA